MIGFMLSAVTALPNFRGKRRLLRTATRLPYRHSRSKYGPLLTRMAGDSNLAGLLCIKPSPLVATVIENQTTAFSFIDVGANHGIFSLLAAANPHCEHIYAFEPNPAVFINLVKNTEINGAKVSCLCAAISSQPGVETLFVPKDWTGGASLHNRRDDTTPLLAIGCDHRALSFCEGSRVIVKIDVEGHEFTVVEQLTLSSIWPRVSGIVVEQLNYMNDGTDAMDHKMKELGFEKAETDISGGKADIYFTRSGQRSS